MILLPHVIPPGQGVRRGGLFLVERAAWFAGAALLAFSLAVSVWRAFAPIASAQPASAPSQTTEVKHGTVIQRTRDGLRVRTNEGVRIFTEADVRARGVKIVRDGRPATLSDFREGDHLTATIVTTRPPASATDRPKPLRKTASPLPALAPAGFASLALGAILTVRCRQLAR